MPRRHVGILLGDMLERIERIRQFVAGLERETFLGDQKTIDSVIRNLEVIGEAASRLPREFLDRNSSVPWRRIVGLRHRIVHEYFDVDVALVWEIVQSELPALEAQLRRLKLGEDAAPGDTGSTSG